MEEIIKPSLNSFLFNIHKLNYMFINGYHINEDSEQFIVLENQKKLITKLNPNVAFEGSNMIIQM